MLLAAGDVNVTVFPPLFETTLTVAVPVAPVLSEAVTVQVPVVFGAVYKPDVDIVPQEADHVTASPPLSVAENCCVLPSATVALDGLTVMVFVVLELTVNVICGDEYTVPVMASCACTTITCEPAGKVRYVSNVLVFCSEVPET